MRTIDAFAKGEANRGNQMMVFDWDKAAQLIKEEKPHNAGAGLNSDWEWTGGVIYSDGKPVMDDYTFLSSTWATPELDMDGSLQDCFIMEDEAAKRWGDVDFAKLKWPQSALDILNPPFSLKASMILTNLVEGHWITPNMTTRVGVDTIVISKEVFKEILEAGYIYKSDLNGNWFSNASADKYVLEILNA